MPGFARGLRGHMKWLRKLQKIRILRGQLRCLALWCTTAMLSPIIFPVFGFATLAFFHSVWAVAFIALFYVTRGMNDPVVKTYINGLVSSEDRATILSVKSLVGRLIFAVIGPFLGWVYDAYSLSLAL